MRQLEPANRHASLDLIKWVAMATMVMDHLRYVWPDMNALFVIGRIAFPWFCLAIAANVGRTAKGQFYNDANANYLCWIVVFAVISELQYRLLTPSTTTLNVMPTLMLGLMICWGVHHKTRDSLLVAGASVLLACVLHSNLMYGAPGALLPAAFLLALQKPRSLWLVPAITCVLANRWLATAGFSSYSLTVFLVAVGAPVAGIWLVNHPVKMRIWPVRRWGYWFYPVHLGLLHLLRQVV